MCMHWLKHVRLNRKDRLKICVVRHWTSPEPTVLFLVFSNMRLGPSDMNLRHWMNLNLIGQQNFNGAALELAFLNDGISNGYTLITMTDLKPWVLKNGFGVNDVLFYSRP